MQSKTAPPPNPYPSLKVSRPKFWKLCTSPNSGTPYADFKHDSTKCHPTDWAIPANSIWDNDAGNVWTGVETLPADGSCCHDVTCRVVYLCLSKSPVASCGWGVGRCGQVLPLARLAHSWLWRRRVHIPPTGARSYRTWRSPWAGILTSTKT